MSRKVNLNIINIIFQISSLLCGFDGLYAPQEDDKATSEPEPDSEGELVISDEPNEEEEGEDSEIFQSGDLLTNVKQREDVSFYSMGNTKLYIEYTPFNKLYNELMIL